MLVACIFKFKFSHTVGSFKLILGSELAHSPWLSLPTAKPNAQGDSYHLVQLQGQQHPTPGITGRADSTPRTPRVHGLAAVGRTHPCGAVQPRRRGGRLCRALLTLNTGSGSESDAASRSHSVVQSSQFRTSEGGAEHRVCRASCRTWESTGDARQAQARLSQPGAKSG